MERHLFFDLDGTLTDPREGIVACLKYALDSLQVTAPSDQDLARLIGPPLLDSFRTLLGAEREHLASEAIALYRERFERVGMYENKVYPGISEGLKELANGGATLWVVTSKPEVFARRIISHFGLTEYFRDVYGSELSGERSNKSDLIAHVLKGENLSPGRVTMIGDRSHDMVGALDNNVRGVGVLWGYGSRAELIESGASAVCGNMAELVSYQHSVPA